MPLPIADLDRLDRDAFVDAVGGAFERSPWIAAETWERRPFGSREALHAALCATLRAAPRGAQLELIRAHPDLAGRLARAAELTAESQREQSSAGLDEMSAEEGAELQRLNAAYRERFDFPFVICARLNDRRSILRSLETRLANGPEAEVEAALGEIEKIAGLRLRDAVTAENEGEGGSADWGGRN
jgi:2-oxo-4-hydroxy-4-carboxy-5-ureidoimidazoline decarboxylase